MTPSSHASSVTANEMDRARNVDGRETSRLVGVVAHHILERWDFALPAGELTTRIGPALDRFLSPDDESRSKIADSLAEIFTTFGASESYARLRSASILGREVPFIIPWGERQVMEGVIDVIYRLDGTIWIADYKTDHTSTSEAPARAALYAHQAAAYREAATRCLNVSQASFQFLFLRAGISVDV
jgi:ATP-dependent helicase/nuclease subunit A